MPNIAALLKSEISRVARKEIRAETESLRKAVSNYRSEIADLKRRLQAIEKVMRGAAKASSKNSGPAEGEDEGAAATRFSARGLLSHRKRLGLSAAQAGLLVGASELSIYKWERGPTRPRARYLPAIARFRTLGKKEAAALLDAMK